MNEYNIVEKIYSVHLMVTKSNYVIKLCLIVFLPQSFYN